MILYIDMDGVVANFSGKICSLLPDIELGDGDPATYTERSRIVTDTVLCNPRLFEKLEVIEGAVEAVEMLRKSYDVYFLSTPMCEIPESYAGKRVWLRDKFGGWADKRLILTHRKDLCIGDILIDDSTRNGAEEFKGEKILFGSPEYPDWKAVLKYLII